MPPVTFPLKLPSSALKHVILETLVISAIIEAPGWLIFTESLVSQPLLSVTVTTQFPKGKLVEILSI